MDGSNGSLNPSPAGRRKLPPVRGKARELDKRTLKVVWITAATAGIIEIAVLGSLRWQGLLSDRYSWFVILSGPLCLLRLFRWLLLAHPTALV